MDLGMQDKVALVTGAGGGLGGAIAEALASEGVQVILADISIEAAQRNADALTSRGAKVLAMQWDLGDLSQTEENVAAVKSQFGGVDILVNNTGGPPPTLAQGVDPLEWEKHFRPMVSGVIHLTDLLLPEMRQKGWGRVITSTSSGVVIPIPNLAISNSLRLALVGWSKTLSREVAQDGVTVNVVLPGRIATTRIQALDKAKAAREQVSVEKVKEMSTDSIPVKRYGKPEEYGAVVAFMASEQASYLNGSVIRVDGGLISSI